MQLISRVVLGATLLAQTGADGGGIDVYAIAKDFGVPAAIVLFVLTEGRQRESRFEKRIAENEKFTRGQLVALWERSNEELRRSTRVMSQLSSIFSRHDIKIISDDPATPQRSKKRTSDVAIAEIPDDESEG